MGICLSRKVVYDRIMFSFKVDSCNVKPEIRAGGAAWVRVEIKIRLRFLI